MRILQLQVTSNSRSAALAGALMCVMVNIDREFEFYDFFSFLKFNEFYEFFSVEKNSAKIRNFANHRCLTCFDVLGCNVHL